MNEEINLDEVMSRRFELDAQISAIEGANKAALAPLVEERELCESFIKSELLKTGAQQWKSSSTGHMTYWTTKDSVTVEDMEQVIHHILAASPLPEFLYGPPDSPRAAREAAWGQVLQHIQNTGLWVLLNKAVNKSAVKEMIEAQAQPPGVRYVSFRDLAWRRGKSQ